MEGHNIKHVNFEIPINLYRKFRLIAAEETISLVKLYRRAMEDFLEKYNKKSNNLNLDKMTKN